jgi:hypothetical protein
VRRLEIRVETGQECTAAPGEELGREAAALDGYVDVVPGETMRWPVWGWGTSSTLSRQVVRTGAACIG